jgi:phosphopantothenoylcysteine decarboxylase/phosphopantothenate--cysteine ligase
MAKENNIIVIAPTTADLLAKLASGRADDLLTNIVLASTAAKILVPAMHPEMWSNAATIQNK